jgi:predicted nucleotidyltransferase
MDLDAAILERVRAVGGISIAVVFGSRAAGTPRPDSDLDVAVLPAEGHSLPRRKLQARVAAALADLAPDGRVDVVFLDEAPELLRQRIFESGRPVLITDEERWKDLRIRTMREHGDREPYRRLLRAAQMCRLTDRSTGGG